jgi:predicted RNA-binding protein Jag
MIKEVTAVGKDILEAKDNARIALGVGELEDVQFEIIDAGTKGFFGFMARPAKVRAFIETPDAPEKKPRFERPKKDKPAPADNGATEENTERREKPEKKKHNNQKNQKKKSERLINCQQKQRHHLPQSQAQKKPHQGQNRAIQM